MNNKDDKNFIVQEFANTFYKLLSCSKRAKNKYENISGKAININSETQNFAVHPADRFIEMSNGYAGELQIAKTFYPNFDNGADSSVLLPMLLNSTQSPDEIVIKPDGMRLDTESGEFIPYKRICGKEIDCPSKMNTEEFSDLYNSTFTKLKEDGELTDDIIDAVTFENINQAYKEKVTEIEQSYEFEQ